LMAKLTPAELAELQDPDTWEDVGEVRPAAKSPRAIVSVAFSRPDFIAVAEYAEQRGMKTSEFIRRAVLERTAPTESAAVVAVTGGVQTRETEIVPPRPKIGVETRPR
jgi:hypothetical protein